MSAKKILEDGDITQAAIAGGHAADLYELHVLESDIANQSDNYTRFVVAARQPVKVDKQIPAKTSLMMVTSNEEGSLIECLNILHKHKINMAKLESRPRMNEPFRYTFYLDIHGNIEDQEVSKGLEELSNKAEELKILGCYPKQEN
jgi:chorismate mutase/prephenate dehydratase